MKRKHIFLLGRVLLTIGIISMVAGLFATMFSYVPQSGIPVYFSEFGLGGLFAGAFLWLMGAHLCGRERIDDRYWCIRYMVRMRQRKA